MRILFECRSIYPNKSAGVENYLYSLIRGWREEAPQDELFLNVPPKTVKEYKKILGVQNITYLVDPFKINYYRIINMGKLGNIINKTIEMLLSKTYFSLAIARKKWVEKCDGLVDCVIYPYKKDLIVHNKPTIYVLHDLYDIDMEDGDKNIAQKLLLNSAKADLIITSWPYPFRRIKEIMPEFEKKVVMIPFVFNKIEMPNTSTKQLNYLLYPSSNAVHKNHENLIHALHVLREKYSKNVKVICTGPQSSVRRLKLEKLINKYDLQKNIIFTGYVQRNVLDKLFKNCLGVISTTYYEAFSGAVLEGFQYGKPIACSKIPPLEEFINMIGIDVSFFDPYSPKSISLGILRLFENVDQYKKQSQNASKYLKKITPQYTASKYRHKAFIVSNGFKGKSI